MVVGPVACPWQAPTGEPCRLSLGHPDRHVPRAWAVEIPLGGTLVRWYRGRFGEAMAAFELDARELKADGWRPGSLEFVTEDRTGRWILAFLLVPLIVGLVYVGRLFREAGFGDLVVIYRRT